MQRVTAVSYLQTIVTFSIIMTYMKASLLYYYTNPGGIKPCLIRHTYCKNKQRTKLQTVNLKVPSLEN